MTSSGRHSILFSSGDLGSLNPSHPGPKPQAAVNFPASSPWALAVGGTGEGEEGSPREVAWNRKTLGAPMATGGGMSGYFARPPHQEGHVPGTSEGTWLATDQAGEQDFQGRWVPDVAAGADFRSGYRMILGGGTSAATPLWAALVARLAAHCGSRLGSLGPALYGVASGGGFGDVTQGDNDISGGAVTAYQAGPGWDPCTGLGVPRGTDLARHFSGT